MLLFHSLHSLLDTATWAVSSQGIQDDLGAKSTNWLAGYTDCQPHFHVCLNMKWTSVGAFSGYIQSGDVLTIRANDTYFRKMSH